MQRTTPTIPNGSLADVGFLLLIFFLITANLQEDYVIKTRIAALRGNVDSTKWLKLDVYVRSGDGIMMNGEALSFKSYQKRISPMFSEGKIKVVFHANSSVSFGRYMEIQDATLRWHREFRDSLIAVENLAENWVRTNYQLTLVEEVRKVDY